MKNSNIELTRGDRNVCQNPQMARGMLSNERNTDRRFFAVRQILYHILARAYQAAGIHNARISIDPDVVDHLSSGLMNEAPGIGDNIYCLLSITNTSLTGAMGEKEIPDDVVRGVLSVSDSTQTPEVADGDILDMVKSTLSGMPILVSEVDKEHTTLGCYTERRMTENEKAILSEAESVNADEHLATIEPLDSVSKRLALITIILVDKGKISWSKISDDVKIKILQAFDPSDSYLFLHARQSGSFIETRVPSILIRDPKISETIVGNQGLWDSYIRNTNPETQYLTGNLVRNSAKAKEQAKRPNEFAKLVEAKSYNAIWRIIVTDSNHPDFKQSGDNDGKPLKADHIHWDDVPENFQNELLLDINFLRAGVEVNVEVNFGSALGALMRNIDTTVINDDAIWDTFFQDDDVMARLLWSSATARQKMEDTTELKKLHDGSMKKSLVCLAHENPKFQRQIANDPSLFEFYIAMGFRGTLHAILSYYGDREAKKTIFENDYLFTLCLQGEVDLDSMLREQEDTKVDSRFQNNPYFRNLAIQNLGDSDLAYIFQKSTTQWPELTTDVLQYFADKGHSSTLNQLAEGRWKLTVPEAGRANKIDGGYVSRNVTVTLGNSKV